MKWATCNVGAEKPEDFGLYFAWGETNGYGLETSDGHLFGWGSYKWCNGSRDTLTKYNSNSDYGEVDNKTVLDPEDDAAHVNWGGSWRMPTYAECQELVHYCVWTWTSENGVAGFKVSGNGNYIFLPAAVFRYGATLYEGSSAGYWSATSDSVDADDAYYLYFYSSDHETVCYSRCYGRSVRPVFVSDNNQNYPHDDNPNIEIPNPED